MGHCARVKDRQGMEKCPEHMTTLLEQVLRQKLTAYTDVFSSRKADISRTGLVEHTISVEPDTALIQQLPRKLDPELDQKVEEQCRTWFDKV